MYDIHKEKTLFIIRTKDNLNFFRTSSVPTKKLSGILYDQTIWLNGFYAQKNFPVKMRMIKFYDADNDRVLIFLKTFISRFKQLEIAVPGGTISTLLVGEL